MLCLTLLRESLGFCNLCRSHAACSIISIVYRELLAVTRQLCCCEVEPHIRLHIVLWHAPSVVIQHPKVVLRPCVALGCLFMEVFGRNVDWWGSRCLPRGERGENECRQES